MQRCREVYYPVAKAIRKLHKEGFSNGIYNAQLYMSHPYIPFELNV